MSGRADYPRCEWCLTIHRYAYPTDADGHEPSKAACINTLRGDLDDAIEFIRWVADQDYRGPKPRSAQKAQALLDRLAP